MKSLRQVRAGEPGTFWFPAARPWQVEAIMPMRRTALCLAFLLAGCASPPPPNSTEQGETVLQWTEGGFMVFRKYTIIVFQGRYWFFADVAGQTRIEHGEIITRDPVCRREMDPVLARRVLSVWQRASHVLFNIENQDRSNAPSDSPQFSFEGFSRDAAVRTPLPRDAGFVEDMIYALMSALTDHCRKPSAETYRKIDGSLRALENDERARPRPVQG